MNTIPTTRDELARALEDARGRSLSLIEDLDDATLVPPRLAVVNPMLWEVGHVAWFQERWALRELAGRAPLRADGDELYDSAAVLHDTRWDVPLPGREETLGYARAVFDAVLEGLATVELDARALYLHHLVLFHEDMHGEALVYTRQTLGLPPPKGTPRSVPTEGGGACTGDVEVPGGEHELGARKNELFVFDNEQWAHAWEVAPFRIARAPVTQGEFRDLVADEGYARRELWSAAGWAWRAETGADAPLHWRRERDAWERRLFDRWVALEEDLPMLHVGWHEAEAYCRWAGRRLPSELEWEYAASAPGAFAEGTDARPCRHPWGHAPAAPERAHLDLAAHACVEVGALPAGDCAFGLRQVTGNVWEWTSSAFRPYPGFVPGDYREYSAPWFDTHRVLRGGAFATRARLLRNTYRNFYTPDRRDVLAGFRTAALEEA